MEYRIRYENKNFEHIGTQSLSGTAVEHDLPRENEVNNILMVLSLFCQHTTNIDFFM